MEINYSAHQKKDDWRVRRFQRNTSSDIKIRKTFIGVKYQALICCLSTLNETYSLSELTVVFLRLNLEHGIEKSLYSPCKNNHTKLCHLLGVFRYC